MHLRSRKASKTVSLLFVISVSCSATTGEEIPVDGYAAVVNNRVINVSDVIAHVQPIERQLRQIFKGEELEAKVVEAFEKGRESLIERALILEEFASQQGNLPDRAIDSRVQEIIRNRFNNDRAAFLATLAEERITLENWREQIKEQLIVAILRQQEVTDKVVVSPGVVRNLYDETLDKYRNPEEVSIRLIVLHQGHSEEETWIKREQAQQVLERAKTGEDFGTLAKTKSEGRKADQGGDWGWVEPGILRPELRERLKHLVPGEVSDVIDTGDKFYIMKLEAKKNASVTPFEKVQEELTNELRQAEAHRLYSAWVGRLKKKHYVETY